MKGSIVLEDNISSISKDMFSFNEDIEEIILHDGVNYIDDEAFKGCKNLKRIRLSNNLSYIGASVFEDCESLEEITIPKSLRYLSNSCFKNCINLKTINIHDDMEYFDDFALYNCKSLSNFKLPNNLKSLGIMALFGCDSIDEIFIPHDLNSIEIGALSMMKSLKKIKVDDNNKKYKSDDYVALLDDNDGTLIQYAIAADNEEYIVGYYEVNYGVDLSSYSLTYNIMDYAFAGAKNLKHIYLPSELESIGAKTFWECDNLKKLTIFYSAFGKVLLFRVVNGWKEKPHIPFEEIEIEEGITSLTDHISFIFNNARKISIPESIEEIGTDVFKNVVNIDKLTLPKKIRSINVDAFDDHIILDFFGFKIIRAKDMKMFSTCVNDGYVRKELNKYDTRVLAMKDGTYYVFLNDFEPIKINRDEIENLSTSSNILSGEPEVFLDYLIDLLSINTTHHEQLMNIIFNDELKSTFESFVNDIKFIDLINKKKHEDVIRELLKHADNNDNFLFNGIVMRNLSKADIILMLENMNPSLIRMIRLSNIFDPNLDNYDINVKPVIDNVSALIKYSATLDRLGLKDRFLYNARFFINLPEYYQELLLTHYNANIKRMIIKSHVLDKDDYYNRNLIDLIRFAYTLGVFSDDDTLSQRSTTFIIEKILSDKNDLGEDNIYKINGDDIHRVFGDFTTKEINREFIDFFIDNYQELYEIEKKVSGFIARVHRLFDEISLYSSSNKGEQRHKKVTVERCKHFFMLKKYDNVTEDNIELAKSLSRFYDDNEILDIASSILEEAKNAPVNIFGSDEILMGKVNKYSYKWMPKQDVENLFLGKYCSCCAHIAGAGAGIMRASMILDNVQNLVILDEDRIIAKMTIWIDKDNGIGVYNTAEVNLDYRSKEEIHLIYEAFRVATLEFIRVYNKNNPDKPIILVTIGEHRNLLKNELNENPNIVSSIDYSKLGYMLCDKFVGEYPGDAHQKQLLVYKK